MFLSIGECLSPPHSPDLSTQREFKENKEPSPKVKRRRSVKISSVALEPTQWQNDALQILTCANDYRSMNDFLMKKVQLWLYLVCNLVKCTFPKLKQVTETRVKLEIA